MLTLVHPWVLVLLPLPLLLRRLAPAHRESRAGFFVPGLQRLERLTGHTAREGAVVLAQPFVQQVAVWICWCLLLAALARPQWLGEPLVRNVPTRDVLLAVDLSGSMEIEDFTDASGSTVDRLSAVKQVLDEFLSRREGDRVGLILFGSAAFVQAPFTEDLDVCRALLDEAQVGMSGPKTVIGDAIGLAITVLERSELDEKVLILLTDGNDTGSRVPPEEAATVARDRGITIHVVAVGDPTGAGEQKLDEDTLRAVATTTSGGYYHAADRGELEQVYARLDELGTREVQTISHRPTTELFSWPLGAMVLLTLLYHLGLDLAWSAGRRRSSRVEPAAAGALAVGALPFLLGMSGLGQFHFLRPLWLLVLPVAAWLVWRMGRRLDPLGRLRAVVDEHLLRHLVLEPSERRQLRPVQLLAVFWIVSSFSLAGPTWSREPSPFQEDAGALAIALEVTPTMLAKDVQPSRLERAKHKINDLLAARSGAYSGLIAYAGSAHLVVPLTRDGEIFAPFLAGLTPELMPQSGDEAAQAVSLARERLAASGRPGSILLVTDGAGPEQVEALRAARAGGGPSVHVLAVAADADAPIPLGSPPAPALDRAALEQLAKAGGGSLTVVQADGSDIERVAARVESSLQAAVDEEGGERWRDRGYPLVGVLALLALFWFRLGWVVRHA